MLSVNQEEIKKFEAIADEWWDKNGKFKPLHKFNPVRIKYITEILTKNYTSLKNLDILDVGCGGGLIAEPLARTGANITAIDPSSKNINIAKAHLAKQKKIKINYQDIMLEDLEKKHQYDTILCLEILEHMDNHQDFLVKATSHLKQGGILFLSTINRNLKSLLLAKFATEYVLRWLPKGTHNFSKFIKPSELIDFLPKETFEIIDLSGVKYNIFTDSWSLTNDVSQNYIFALKKI